MELGVELELGKNKLKWLHSNIYHLLLLCDTLQANNFEHFKRSFVT